MTEPTTDTFIEGHTAERLEIVAAINQLETVATESELAASDTRYEQAKKVVEALDSGMTQQQVADVWERADGTSYSQQHVSFVKKAHEEYYYSSNRPSWYEAYNSDEVRGKKPHVSKNTGENEWYTPPEYINAAVDVMGGIDTDPASSVIANKAIGATEFYTIADDGLNQDWYGRVWLNPPYAKGLVEKFVDKLLIEYRRENTTEAIILTNNASETSWYQRLGTAQAMSMPKTRIQFWQPNTRETATGLQGQTFHYLGENADKFVKRFALFGRVHEL